MNLLKSLNYYIKWILFIVLKFVCILGIVLGMCVNDSK